MPGPLYLDTARLGLMRPAAQRANRDFARLCAREGASPRFERLLRHGLDSLPGRLTGRYPGLADWRGVGGLKESLRRLVAAPPDAEVLLAHRSAQLMKLAARALFRRCRRVLHTDLEWPGYLVTLESEGHRAGGRTVPMPVRDAAFRDRISPPDLIASMANSFRHHRCDGLFLSAVTYEGVRLPIDGLVDVLSTTHRPRLVVIDGAQSLGHTPPGDLPCDLLLAGCHKWLGAGHPLGIGVLPRPSSRDFLRAVEEEMIAAGDLDDPLLLFGRQLERDDLEPFTETVSLVPLLTGAAAAADSLTEPQPIGARFEARIRNGDGVAALAAGTGWRPARPTPLLRSGILMLEADEPDVQAAAPQSLREAFATRNVIVSAYAGGRVRLSMPGRRWLASELRDLGMALQVLNED